MTNTFSHPSTNTRINATPPLPLQSSSLHRQAQKFTLNSVSTKRTKLLPSNGESHKFPDSALLGRPKVTLPPSSLGRFVSYPEDIEDPIDTCTTFAIEADNESLLITESLLEGIYADSAEDALDEKENLTIADTFSLATNDFKEIYDQKSSFTTDESFPKAESPLTKSQLGKFL
jgi:hypothetical protein